MGASASIPETLDEAKASELLGSDFDSSKFKELAGDGTTITGAQALDYLNSSTKNSAFVFIKPHANTEATQVFVKEKLGGAGLTIVREVRVEGGCGGGRPLNATPLPICDPLTYMRPPYLNATPLPICDPIT
jgi:hypothetical protein